MKREATVIGASLSSCIVYTKKRILSRAFAVADGGFRPHRLFYSFKMAVGLDKRFNIMYNIIVRLFVFYDMPSVSVFGIWRKIE